ncbi:tRNA-dihydrouridine synthase [Patescibacteria group bacterium]|nr:tRNA-dihydrouridine synthase [Patescibacteria group bacterium]MCG2695039.1 tRNA-dihydrouridine synthase [Candidatus Parcubacteria bacterium]
MKNFWKKIKKPIMVVAPMLDVTDTAFRQIIAKYGKPDVFWTEFVSVDGLCSEEGREKLKKNLLQFDESERPIVAQIFGSKPENFEKSAKIIAELGFDGIDINMGCPQKNILKQGAGSDLIKTPKLAKEIIQATKRGAGNLPVSVKTRIGYNKNEVETWISAILEEKPAVLTIHGRTKKEMSKVPAHWDVIKRAVEIRDKMKSNTLIIGNGDVQNLESAEQKVRETGVDGVMIGRGIFGNPWLFAGLGKIKNQEIKKIQNNQEITFLHSQECKNVISVKDKLKVALEHTKLFEKIFGETKENKKLFGGNGRARNFALMKKHYKAYVNGFDGAKELRIKLMEAKNLKEVEKIFKEAIKKF